MTPPLYTTVEVSRCASCCHAFEVRAPVVIYDLSLHPTPTDSLLRLDVDRHLVSIGSGNGAHFDGCAYIVDLMNTFIRHKRQIQRNNKRIKY